MQFQQTCRKLFVRQAKFFLPMSQNLFEKVYNIVKEFLFHQMFSKQLELSLINSIANFLAKGRNFLTEWAKMIWKKGFSKTNFSSNFSYEVVDSIFDDPVETFLTKERGFFSKISRKLVNSIHFVQSICFSSRFHVDR